MRVALSARMRSVLAAFLLIASASLGRAGVYVELTDGTKLTVESHWTDGEQVHLVRGGVDMIVPKSRIKSIDENASDPEVYRDGAPRAARQGEGGTDVPAEAAAEPAEKPLGEMSAAELQVLHVEESDKLLEAQDKRFGALYGGQTDPKEQQAAREAFTAQNKRNAKVWFALEKAKKADAAGAPSVPGVEQPQ